MVSPAKRDPSASSGGGTADTSLVHANFPISSYPAYRGKQVALTIAALVLAVTTFLPWWRAEIPLNRVTDSLDAWELAWTGLGIGNLSVATGYNVVGNILFGLVPVVPMLLLVVLLVLRVSGLALLPANSLFLWSFLSLMGIGWLFVFGMFRVDASNGVFPILVGPWIVLVVTLALCVLLAVWWTTERQHYPKRRWLGFGPQAPEVREELDPEALFADIETDAAAEDVPIDTSTIDISEVVERTKRRQEVLSDDPDDTPPPSRRG